MWTVWYGCVINLVLYQTACSPAHTMLRLAGLLSEMTFLLVKLTSKDEIGKHTLHKMGARLASRTKTYLRSILTAQWRGYRTKLVMSFPQNPSWRGCLLMAVVFTALCIGTQLVISGLDIMLKGILLHIMPLVAVTLHAGTCSISTITLLLSALW